MEKLRRRARRHGRSTEEEAREILRNAVRDEGGEPKALGSRLAARFAGVGLTEEIPELRGQPARPAARSRSGTSRSPGSPRLAKRPSQPATCATSRDSASHS